MYDIFGCAFLTTHLVRSQVFVAHWVRLRNGADYGKQYGWKWGVTTINSDFGDDLIIGGKESTAKKQEVAALSEVKQEGVVEREALRKKTLSLGLLVVAEVTFMRTNIVQKSPYRVGLKP